MRKRSQILFLGIAGSLLVFSIAPMLVPIPPLQGTVSPLELGDAESRFIRVDGIQVHYKISGSGEPVYMLLHGFAACLFSWRQVMPQLAKQGTVIAFDRPGFGLTERPLAWKGSNPYSSEFAADLTIGLMDQLGVKKAILVGNSAGGAISVLAALRHPERIEALVLVDAAIYMDSYGPSWLQVFSRFPQVRRLGPLLVRNIQNWGLDFARSAWHNPSLITPDIWAGYTLPLKADHWDRGLWEFQLASHALHLSQQLKDINIPALVITGDDDRIVPAQQSVQLSKDIYSAQLVVIPNCGHVPQEECPAEFLDAVQAFIKDRSF